MRFFPPVDAASRGRTRRLTRETKPPVIGAIRRETFVVSYVTLSTFDYSYSLHAAKRKAFILCPKC